MALRFQKVSSLCRYYTVFQKNLTRLFISEWDWRYVWLQTTAEHNVVWSMWAGDHRELFSCVHLNRGWLFHAKSHELTDAFLACPPDWVPGPPLLCNECSLTLPGFGTLYPSCGFSLANCWCFQVSNPCRAIHSTLSVHHTVFTDRDF